MNENLNNYLRPKEFSEPITTTVQEVANRFHRRIYGSEESHKSLHSCPCYHQALFCLGLEWPEGENKNE